MKDYGSSPSCVGGEMVHLNRDVFRNRSHGCRQPTAVTPRRPRPVNHVRVSVRMRGFGCSSDSRRVAYGEEHVERERSGARLGGFLAIPGRILTPQLRRACRRGARAPSRRRRACQRSATCRRDTISGLLNFGAACTEHGCGDGGARD